VTEDLDRLRRALDAVLPPKAETNLPVATWDIRALSHLKAKWAAGPKDSPKWDWHAVACLAEVISRFNVVAVQEARCRPKALKHLFATLGTAWRVVVSDLSAIQRACE
jgi:hypothetical protein